MNGKPAQIGSLARFSLTTADASTAARFYEAAFGCRRIASDHLHSVASERLLGVAGGADRITLAIGREIIELVQFNLRGEPYPRESTASDSSFQHLALVVPDMTRALNRLSAVTDWAPISLGGPQQSPASSGSVLAFKFRDPEGHPLELLSFPKGGNALWPSGSTQDTCLGIDHSAIVVADDAASIAFYERLGLQVTARSINHGATQEKLDALPGAHVAVTALAPLHTPPHLELLSYRSPHRHLASLHKSNDIESTRLVFAVPVGSSGANDSSALGLMRDPDGHALLLVVGN